ncbi:NAD(P)-binding protein [Sistotremastrum suecicum HHB10207 ss-3]|uniref:NAD(P)-binding protein n=1 Tax=Sistotremastrum suecicum HHB10207 ss-3 TaxID=1314776 RepID=A0A166CHK6_9AGAM|nr:NAD(P)-binding protein [Sistotremastrum suecicum HHB10207 ss-3]
MSVKDAETILTGLTAGNIFNMTGVVAVVTGGGSGIGVMISTTLMVNGATVYIIGLEQAALDKTANAFNDAAKNIPGSGRIIGIQGDISLKEEAARLAEEIGKREKYITVLFNNAGVQGQRTKQPDEATAAAYHKVYWALEPESFDKTLKANSFGPYWMSIAFLPLLEAWKASEGGKKFPPQIVMTSSMNGWTKDPATAGYSCPYLFSKSAVGHFTSTLAHDLLPLGIRVNGIAPGLFLTEMSAPGSTNYLGVSSHKDPFDFKIPTVPSGGTNRDVGSLALMLVANWYINGETVLIDGGTLLQHPSSY